MKETSTTSLSNVIGCIFKNLRYERGVDQDLVALRLNLSVSTISKIELGNVSVTVDTIYRFCELFGIEMVDFFIYLEKAKNFLSESGVKVYVDKSMNVKGVEKRSVSYEIEKKYEGIGEEGAIVPYNAIDLNKLMNFPSIEAALSVKKDDLSKTIKPDDNTSSNQESDKPVASDEKAKVEKAEKLKSYTLPILHIKQLYILLEEFFEKNSIPLNAFLQKNIEEMYEIAAEKRKLYEMNQSK